MKTLYICYFGLREPLVQTQVIPYLLEIMKGGVEVSLLTFEPALKESWTSGQIETEHKSLSEKGIEWHHLPYHKRPSVPATFYDIMNGARLVKKLLRRENFDVLHCRIHIPALMAVLARRLSSRKPKILFDIRGFFPDEYTDAGIWPENGWLYRFAKRVEKWLMDEADGFVVLTEKAREILFTEAVSAGGFDRRGRPVEVIPCCVDMSRFRAANEDMRREMRRELNVEDRLVFAYVGSFDGWYLSDKMIDFLEAARVEKPNLFALVMTQRGEAEVENRLRKAGFGDDDFRVLSARPAEIPNFLCSSDFALSFIKECYSKKAASPTKIAEYLASGLPIVANRGVGDIDELIETDRVGVLLDGFDKSSYLQALEAMDVLLQEADLAKRCAESAGRRFDLTTVGGPRYRNLYRKLSGDT